MRLSSALLFFVVVAQCAFAAGWQSTRVVVEPSGRLSYPADEQQNRIPDFSNSGYGGGGVQWPGGTVAVELFPDSDSSDDAARIEAAIAAAASSGSFENPAVVLLRAGAYELQNAQIEIVHNNVILRGEGSGTDGTVITHYGSSREPVLRVYNPSLSYRGFNSPTGVLSEITDNFVQVGSRSFNVQNSSGFSVGDEILVVHPGTKAWLENATNDGHTVEDEPWSVNPGANNFTIRYHRIITAIDGNRVTVDAPVFQHLNRAWSQSYIVGFDDTGRRSQVGIEHLRISIDSAGSADNNHPWDAVVWQYADDCWAENVVVEHFWSAGFRVDQSTTRVTVFDCEAIDPHGPIDSHRYNFMVEEAQLVLFENCFSRGARHSFVGNGTVSDSGIVFLNCIADKGDAIYQASEGGHRQWSQGFLFDNVVNVSHRGSETFVLGCGGNWGTGHGWMSANSVMWNCNNGDSEVEAVIQKPPGAQNYAIGGVGRFVKYDDNGTFNWNSRGGPEWDVEAGWMEGENRPGLNPSSLYLAQLSQRLSGGGPISEPPQPSERPITQESPPVEMKQKEIGNPVLSGTIEPGPSEGSYTVAAAGADIWNTTDRFTFLYRSVAGDGEMTVRVDGLVNTHPSAKAGLMIRSALFGDSAHASISMKPSNDCVFHWREQTGAFAEASPQQPGTSPVWLKLRRTGTLFTGLMSTDGLEWSEIGSTIIAMPEAAYWGIATTSHDAMSLTIAEYSDLAFAVDLAIPQSPSGLSVVKQ